MKVRAEHDSSREIIFERDLADDELLDCDIYAKEVAEMFGMDLSKEGGHIPDGCGDFTITLADDPDSAVCWSHKSYFFA